MDAHKGVEALRDLRALLAKVCGPTKFVILKFNVIDIKEDFTCELRTSINEEVPESYSGKCDSWRDRLARELNCNFIAGVRVEGERFVYRKSYKCHLNKKNKATTRVKADTRNKMCEATLEMKVLNNNPQQRWRDKKNGGLLTEGLDTQIKINFKHTHPVNDVEQIRLLRIPDETKTIFDEYFLKGMNPAAAKAYHEMQLLLDINADSEEKRDEALADASRNPRYGQVHHLHDNWRRERLGDKPTGGTVDLLRAKQADYEERGFTLHIQEDPLTIIVVTPIMKRAHQKEFAGNVIFVGSSGCGSFNRSSRGNYSMVAGTFTFLFAPCKIGPIPLAFIVHQDQNEVNYTSVFKALREVVGPGGFGGKGEPATFITDYSTPQRLGLKAAFPSSVLLLSTSNVCETFWRYLSDKKNGLGREKRDKREELMSMVRKIVYAPTQAVCDEATQAMRETDIYQSNKSFQKYVDDILNMRPDWCLFEQKATVTKVQHTNNIIEAPLRIFKDYILGRCKAFNSATLLDFVTSTLENYHSRRLLFFANMHDAKPEMQYQRFLKKCSGLKVWKMSESESVYKVSSETDEVEEHQVDIENATCDCPLGIGGRFCKHLCAIHVKEKPHHCNLPKLSDSDRVDLVYIALGSVLNSNSYLNVWTAEDDANEELFEDVDVCSDSDVVTKTEPESKDGQLAPQAANFHFISFSSCSREEINQEFLGLQNEVSRIGELCQSVGSPDRQLLLSLQRLRNGFCKVRTVMQMHNLCRIKSKSEGEHVIQTRPASRSGKREGSPSGAEPSDFEGKKIKV